MNDFAECVDLEKLRTAFIAKGAVPPDDLERFFNDTMTISAMQLRARQRSAIAKSIKNTAELSPSRKSLFKNPIAHVYANDHVMSIAKPEIFVGVVDSPYHGTIIRGWTKEYFLPKKILSMAVGEDAELDKTILDIMWAMAYWPPVRISFDKIMRMTPKRTELRAGKYLAFELPESPSAYKITLLNAKASVTKYVVSVPVDFFHWNIFLFDRKTDVNMLICNGGLLLWDSTFFLWVEAA